MAEEVQVELKLSAEEVKRLRRNLKRCSEQYEKMAAEHGGNEQNFTYHGGFSLGYLKGKMYVLDDILSILEEIKE